MIEFNFLLFFYFFLLKFDVNFHIFILLNEVVYDVIHWFHAVLVLDEIFHHELFRMEIIVWFWFILSVSLNIYWRRMKHLNLSSTRRQNWYVGYIMIICFIHDINCWPRSRLIIIVTKFFLLIDPLIFAITFKEIHHAINQIIFVFNSYFWNFSVRV